MPEGVPLNSGAGELGGRSSLQTRTRAPRPTPTSGAVQPTGQEEKEDWRCVNVSRIMANLRSPSRDVRALSLKRLHVRWHHANTTQMTQLLRAAGVPPHVLAEVVEVVRACLVCRDWHKPSPHNITTFRLTLSFNEEVQFDLVFYHSLIDQPSLARVVVNLVDTCVRWCATKSVGSKEEVELLTAVSAIWIFIHGPMETLVLDEETGMRGRAAQDWAESNGISLKYKAPRQKAWLVERHNELLREGLHVIETQMIKEGIKAPFEQILATATFMKNALTSVNGSTPYQAVLGRQPAMLPPLEGGYLGQIDDSHSRAGTNARQQARVREIAACAIIEATAKARLQRADRHHTRAAVELRQLEPRQLVDIWFEPTNKDCRGWRGPAEIATINASDGNVTVRYQGRSLDRQGSEVRPHIPYLVFWSALHTEQLAHWLLLRGECEALRQGSSKTYGLVLDQHSKVKGWVLTNASRTTAGQHILESAMLMGNVALHLPRCTTMRMANGLQSMPPLKGFIASELWYWRPTHLGGASVEAPHMFVSEPGDLDNPVNLKQLVGDLREVRSGECAWQSFCALQFWCVADEEAAPIIEQFPGIPLMAGAGLGVRLPAGGFPEGITPAPQVVAPGGHPGPNGPGQSADVPVPGLPPAQPVTPHVYAPPPPPPCPPPLGGILSPSMAPIPDTTMSSGISPMSVGAVPPWQPPPPPPPPPTVGPWGPISPGPPHLPDTPMGSSISPMSVGVMPAPPPPPPPPQRMLLPGAAGVPSWKVPPPIPASWPLGVSPRPQVTSECLHHYQSTAHL